MTRTPSPRSPGRPRTAPLTVVSHAKTAVDAEPSAANPAEDDDVAAGPMPVDSLSEMMTGLQGAANSRITIYRIVKNQPPSYVAECAPESFSLDELRDKYQGGEFRLYIQKDGRLWKNMRVFVEAPVRPAVEVQAASSSGLGDVMALMREGFAAQAAAIREAAAARSSAPSLLSGDNLPAIITAITGALVALRPAPAPPPPPAPDTDVASKSIDMFMQGLQLARELREDSAPADTSIGGMLQTVLKSPLMAQAVAAATTPQPAQPRLAAPVAVQQRPAAPAPTPNPAPPTQPEAADMNLLHYYYGMLCQKAADGADPVLYAELVLDNVPDETLQTLLTKQPTPLDALIAEYPAAAPHREWFAVLIDTLMSAMTEEQPDETPAPVFNGAPTDAAHVQPPVVPGQPS